MSEEQMDARHRDLILAAEISGVLHDLGKLHPEFAREKSKDGESLIKNVQNALQYDAHGAILEEDARAYPPVSEETWLQQIKQHEGWAQVLRLSEDWIKAGTIQAHGLGDPLRQHHAGRRFPKKEFGLLGDLYTFGADIRDSAFDKGSGATIHAEQHVNDGFISDSFGNECQSYGPEPLRKLWTQARQIIESTLLLNNACQDVPKARKHFLKGIKEFFLSALGETRRPTNDVTLWHHSYSSASLFKAAVAEAILRRSFGDWQNKGYLDASRLGRIRFRLLGIRWDWAALAGGALQPVALTALAENRREAIDHLRQRLEVDYPVGNLIYDDDNGAVFVVGGFYEGTEDSNGQTSEALFQQHILEPLQHGILKDLAPLGVGAAVRLAWTQPRLYLTDYPEVMAVDWNQASSDRQRLLQVGESELRALWAKQSGNGQQVQICPQCGLRPGPTRELTLNESGLGTDETGTPFGLCNDCQKLVDHSAHTQRRRAAKELFSFEPRTFNLQTIRSERNPAGNSRLVLLSVRVNPEIIATGAALLTQLARPFAEIELRKETRKAGAEKHLKTGDAGDFLERVIRVLAQCPSPDTVNEQLSEGQLDLARDYLGDNHWITSGDGRIEGTKAELARKGYELLEAFFLRESIPPDAGLYRHNGDQLLLFGMRKHASPGRLARTWDDLRALWQQILWDIAGDTQQWLMPLSLDAGGFRIIVAANDARKALGRIQQRVNETLGKVRAGLDVHVSALAFREKFPLYIALDALRRMERRIAKTPPQTWTLRSALNRDGTLLLNWETPQGPVQWTVNFHTGDPNQTDLWYPHAICVSRDPGPGRLVRLDQLESGEIIRLRPSTFDFMALDGTARRYDLRYDAEGRRPHFILGEPGRRPYLLEQLDEVLNLSRQTGWNVSQTKGLIGQIIECYEKWVRDVPAELRPQGRDAWRSHCAALFRRYLKDQPATRDRLIALFQDEEHACLLFDAFEWSGFIEKDAHSHVEESEAA
ncbi:MAG: hypothetical protein LAE24_12205 [Candidatus Contendobacter sp.]|nr:hypothetical protein [Candidatus Contendobacter sp.]